MTTKEQQETIQHLLDSKHSFALYRLPRTKQVELVLQSDKSERKAEKNEQETVHKKVLMEGFIFAPFNETRKRPTIHIRPDVTATDWEEISQVSQRLVTTNRQSLSLLSNKHAHSERATESNDYRQAFTRLHKKIQEGRFEKLVLSYCQSSTEKHLLGHEAKVFLKALEAYPDAMVYLVNSPHCGRWMGCTPELLLQRKGNEWHTVALAGTTENTNAEWDSKNIFEQDVVAQYITQTLQALGAENIERSNCDTMQIGRLSHRRTQFNFTFSRNQKASNIQDTLDIARALHPTPAVCGLPKDDAKKYLLRAEHTDRNYFSGYLGRLETNGDAQIFVNLRCAQITDNCTYYHAGGGLTAASQLEDEAREIDLKMETLKTLL